MWETTKENIKPLKVGRSANILNENESLALPNASTALKTGLYSVNPVASFQQQSKDIRTDAEVQIREFENQILIANDDDLLEAWYRYLKWFVDTFPNGREKQLKSLAVRSIKRLSNSAKFSTESDERYWFIWKILASTSQRMGSITLYSNMLSTNCCTKVAGYYKEWAAELIKLQKLDEALDVYRAGLNNGAQPYQDLQQLFESLHLKLYGTTREPCILRDDYEEETRFALGALKLGKKGTAPVVRTSSTKAMPLVIQSKNSNPTTKPHVEIYNENEGVSRHPISNYANSSGASQPTPDDIQRLCLTVSDQSQAENTQAPSIWSHQKMKIPAKISLDMKPNFVVYDEALTHNDQNSERASSQNIQPPVAPQHIQKHVVEYKQTPIYEEKAIWDGEKEISFEEIRAKIWFEKKKLASDDGTGSVSMEETTCIQSMVPPAGNVCSSNENKENMLPVAESLHAMAMKNFVGNTSFTAKLQTQVFSAFNQTCGKASNETCEEQSDIPEHVHDEQELIDLKAPPTINFKIYEETINEKTKLNEDPYECDDNDKENRPPPDMFSRAQISQRNETNTSIVDDGAELCNVSRPNFEESSYTVANCMKPFLGQRVISSTPCHTNQQPVEFMPFNVALNDDMQENMEPTIIQPARFAKPIVEEISKDTYLAPVGDSLPIKTADSCSRPYTQLYEVKTTEIVEEIVAENPTNSIQIQKRLSAITEETSRDFRSSSSSSGSSNGCSSIGRGNRLNYQTGHCSSILTPFIHFDHYHTTSTTSILHFQQHQSFPCSSLAKTPQRKSDFVSGSDVKKYPNATNDDEVEEIKPFRSNTPDVLEIDPWDLLLIDRLIGAVEKSLNLHKNFHCFEALLPDFESEIEINLGGEMFFIGECVETSFENSVYHCTSLDSNGDEKLGRKMICQVQKPANRWEFYIHDELKRRLNSQKFETVWMHNIPNIEDGYFFDNGSVFLYEFRPVVALTEVVDVYKRHNKLVPESIVIAIVVELIKILDAVHCCNILYFNLKPINVLITNSLFQFTEPNETNASYDFNLTLIDWNRAIDLNAFPSDVVFSSKNVNADDKCCEMIENKPWTFQADYFGLLSTTYTLLFGDVMKISKIDNRWKPNCVFKRIWRRDLWASFFDTLLNTPLENHRVDLNQFRLKFLDYLETLDLEIAVKDLARKLGI